MDAKVFPDMDRAIAFPPGDEVAAEQRHGQKRAWCHVLDKANHVPVVEQSTVLTAV